MTAETRNRNRVSPEGKAAGFQMVRMVEPAIAYLECEGEPDERCKSCAFRLNTVPNGCIQTQLDALKCVVEGVPFQCHQSDRGGHTCHGWFAGRVAMRLAEEARGVKLEMTCPWEFSPPDEPEASNPSPSAREE